MDLLPNMAWTSSQLFMSVNIAISDISKAILNPGAQRAESPGIFSKLEAGYCFTRYAFLMRVFNLGFYENCSN